MSRPHRGNPQHEQADLDEVLSPRLSARFVRLLLADEEALDEARAGEPRAAVAPVARSGVFDAALAAVRREALLVAAVDDHAADAAPARRALGRLAATGGRHLFDWAPNRRAQRTGGGGGAPGVGSGASVEDTPASRAEGISAVLGGGVAAYAVRARVSAGSSYDALARAIAAVSTRLDRAVEAAGALARELGTIEAVRWLVAAGPIDAATLGLVDGAPVEGSPAGGAEVAGASVDAGHATLESGVLAAWTEASFDEHATPRAGGAPKRLPPAGTTSELAAALARWVAAPRTPSRASRGGETAALGAAATSSDQPVAPDRGNLATVAAPDELGRLRDAGDLAGLVEALGVRGAGALEHGSWAAATRLLEEAAAVNAAVQRPAHAAQAMVGVTVALRGSGRTAEAVAAARRAVALAPGGPSKVAALAALGAVEAAVGRRDAAVSAFDQAIATGQASGLLPELVEALVRRRDQAAAR